MNDVSSDWIIERHTGRASHLHGLDVPARPERTVRVMEVDRSALVLGSSQSEELVDMAAASRAGVEVARRRSGGGAVLLGPDRQTWVDLFVPAGDPLWNDDVVAAADWVGATWAAGLEQLDLGPGVVHRGGVVKTDWSSLVCFAGLGPGEVSVSGRKVVGVSQRRNRSWIRIQTTAFVSWEPDELADLLVLSASEHEAVVNALSENAASVAARPEALLAGLLDSLPG